MVDHELLLLKLKTYGIDEASNKWFESYLLRRQQFVSYFGKVSNYQDVSHGVPQGSILGPLFFIIYINDLPLHIQTTDVEIDLYADDTTLMSSADIDAIGCDLRSKINQVWLEVENWANANKMPLNESINEVSFGHWETITRKDCPSGQATGFSYIKWMYA